MAYQFPCIRFVEIVSPFFGIVLILRSSSLVTRCLPRLFDDLADFNAILGSRCWLGFTASGLSPDKKRLALLGAQRHSNVTAAELISPHLTALAQTLQRRSRLDQRLVEQSRYRGEVVFIELKD